MKNKFLEFKSVCYNAENLEMFQNNGKREEFNRKNSIYYANEFPVDVLFIGDSITESFEVQPYFGELGSIVNRGIGGEAVEGLSKRFDLDVVMLKPKVCVLSEGINNSYELYQQYAKGVEITDGMIDSLILQMLPHYAEMIEKCLCANIRLIISSVLPLGVYDFRNKFILKLNSELEKLCKKKGVLYVDTYSALTEPDGILMKDYTFGDKLHPHVLGYNVLAKTLKPYIKKEIEKYSTEIS